MAESTRRSTGSESTHEKLSEAGKKGAEARWGSSHSSGSRSEDSHSSSKSSDGSSHGRSTRGGTSEQHAEAGRQSHKNN